MVDPRLPEINRHTLTNSGSAQGPRRRNGSHRGRTADPLRVKFSKKNKPPIEKGCLCPFIHSLIACAEDEIERKKEKPYLIQIV